MKIALEEIGVLESHLIQALCPRSFVEGVRSLLIGRGHLLMLLDIALGIQRFLRRNSIYKAFLFNQFASGDDDLIS